MRAYQGAVPGAGVAVLRDGVPVVRRAYGLADVESRVAATTATNYRLASLTKQFTAAAILLLAEDRRLSIDDSVRRVAADLPEAADGMSIRHLLTHTSGARRLRGPDPAGRHCAVARRRCAAAAAKPKIAAIFRRERATATATAATSCWRSSSPALRERISRRFCASEFSYRSACGVRVAFEAGVSAVADRAFGYSARRRSGCARIRV